MPAGGAAGVTMLLNNSPQSAAGAKTPLATIVTSAVVVLTLLFLLPLFAPLPDAVLGAIVVLAVLLATVALWRARRLA